MCILTRLTVDRTTTRTSLSRLDPLKPSESLAQQAASELRQRILAGDFAGGERLVEAQIARQLGISRGPVREALRQLRAEGLVEEEPRRGTFVMSMSADDIREVFDLRAALEVRAVRLLMTARDSEPLTRLRESLTAIRKAVDDGDRSMAARSDLAFHAALCQLSGNQRLYSVFVSNAALLQALLRLDDESLYESLDELFAEHEELVTVVESGDVGRAEQLIDEHLEQTKTRLLKHATQLAAVRAS